MTPNHGTRSRYNSLTDKCRCDDCRAANTKYLRWIRRVYRERRKAQTGN